MVARTASQAPRPPLLSISIVSHGDSAPLQSLLGSLVLHEAASRLQLIVTDNLGRDLPELDPSPWHSLTLLRNEHPAGYASNQNAAFQHARADDFCVINPDVLLVEPVLSQLIGSIESGKVAIIAPLVVDSQGVIQDSFRSLPSPRELVQRRLGRTAPATSFPSQQTVVRSDWIAGIFMLFRRDTYARLNGFDSRYRLYFEDVDFCTRARLAGLASGIDTRVRIEHDARRASRRLGLQLFWHLQSSLRFFSSPVYRQAKALSSIPASPV